MLTKTPLKYAVYYVCIMYVYVLSCDKGVIWVCTVNVNANVTANVNANSIASYCSLYKEITFWKTFCLGKSPAAGQVQGLFTIS